MSLINKITDVLKKLQCNEAIPNDPNTPTASNDDGKSTVSQVKKGRFFCYEDTFASKDINIEIEGIGQLHFPLDKNSIENIIRFSSKAKFGSGEKTMLDTNIRDTQTIPADKLKVTINEKALTCVLERIGFGLNIDKKSAIVPYIHNMLIYAPGQFFKKHTDSEKIPNMIATLVIVLPSEHKGGDLIIEHNEMAHVFFGSQNFDVIKCVAFYADCEHEIEKVTEGYRVALTYNVVLKSSNITDIVAVNEDLAKAVAQYFAGPDFPQKLIFYLNHSYTKRSLNWNLLKGTDRTHAHALLAVAKKQNRIPYLVLADYQETRECSVSYICRIEFYDAEDGEVCESETSLDHWVDEHNKVVYESVGGSLLNDVSVSEDEVCYTIETTKLCEPYKQEESGPTGNEGATCDYWYQRACVVLFSSKWVFKRNYEFILNKFYQLTTQTTNKNLLLKHVNKIGDGLLQIQFFNDSSVIKKLLSIVLYLENSEKAVLILSHLAEQLLTDNMIELLVQLESQYNAETWSKIFQNWKDKKIKCSISFVNKYKDFSKNKIILEFLLEEIIDTAIENNLCASSGWYNYSRSSSNDVPMKESQKKELLALLQICFDVGYELGKQKLIMHVKSKYSAVNQSEIFFWLQDNLYPNHFIIFKELRDHILKLIKQEVLKLPDINDWSLPIQIRCDCEHCNQVNAFFKSTTATKLVVPTTYKNKTHVFKFLKFFSNQPIKFDALKENKSGYKMLVEKLPIIKTDKQKKIQDLTTLITKLECVAFFEVMPIKPVKFYPTVKVSNKKPLNENSTKELDAGKNSTELVVIKTTPYTNSGEAVCDIPLKRHRT